MIRTRTRYPRLALKLTAAAIVLSHWLTPVAAGTLENMERERSLVVDTMLDAAITPGERHGRFEARQPRLIDLERMVLRDDALVGRNTPAVRRAFENYDLTFMVHAATEGNLSITDLWLDQLGISTESLMASRYGRR